MALIRPGSLAGQVSGSLGNTVFSRNRYGSYVRKRVSPTKVVNAHTLAARGRLVAASQAWGALDADTKRAWETWAEANPITNRIGDRQTLTGHAAFAQVNSRVQLANETMLVMPPTETAPEALETITVTCDLGPGTFQVAFTETPLGADDAIYLQAAVLSKPGQQYFRNKLRLVHVGEGGDSSPVGLQALLEARFGALQVGQRVVVLASVMGTQTGLLSGARVAIAPVVDTTA